MEREPRGKRSRRSSAADDDTRQETAARRENATSPTAGLRMLSQVASPHLKAIQAAERQARKGLKRKDKSLVVLCQSLQDYCEERRGEPLCLEEVAKALNAERRRVYDIVNVMEGLNVMERRAKNHYHWNGAPELPATLSKIKGAANKFFTTVKPAKGTNCRIKPTTIVNSRSLGVLAQRFIMLFFLIDDGALTQEEAFCIFTHENNQPPRQNETRRLYDIANVLVSLDLITKVPGSAHRKPCYLWRGPKVATIVASKNVDVQPGDGTEPWKMKQTLITTMSPARGGAAVMMDDEDDPRPARASKRRRQTKRKKADEDDEDEDEDDSGSENGGEDGRRQLVVDDGPGAEEDDEEPEPEPELGRAKGKRGRKRTVTGATKTAGKKKAAKGVKKAAATGRGRGHGGKAADSAAGRGAGSKPRGRPRKKVVLDAQDQQGDTEDDLGDSQRSSSSSDEEVVENEAAKIVSAALVLTSSPSFKALNNKVTRVPLAPEAAALAQLVAQSTGRSNENTGKGTDKKEREGEGQGKVEPEAETETKGKGKGKNNSDGRADGDGSDDESADPFDYEFNDDDEEDEDEGADQDADEDEDEDEDEGNGFHSDDFDQWRENVFKESQRMYSSTLPFTFGNHVPKLEATASAPGFALYHQLQVTTT